MKNCNFKALVLSKFPELSVKMDSDTSSLFVMLNKNGYIFDERTSAISANKVWEIAHTLMLRGELQPNWKEDSETSRKLSSEKLAEAKKDTNREFLSKNEVKQLIDEVINEFDYK